MTEPKPMTNRDKLYEVFGEEPLIGLISPVLAHDYGQWLDEPYKGGEDE